MRVYHKAYVYLTCGTDLLVFNEPDTPHLGLQVPGGTVDPGESFLKGAMREFAEETGLTLDAAFDHFSDQDLPFETFPKVGQFLAPPNRPLKGRHIRRNYHVTLSKRPKEKWEHFEMFPSSGGDPIRCHFFWIDLFGAEAMTEETFFAAFGAPLSLLRKRLAPLQDAA
ncbi:NUDIX domain-containing protein [Roseibium porphyridii]|uniref:NUDIX domain-containing protein n=1 Tax=Roseibium porphyridii TaxID=2866279 RepID=A0ABY8FB92_9HYPH|nr:NUDIX domain-containing protein [Roseibium sp. KMA01]WFE90530.1 NUDIX domain-containing protein [Roseibium sp. KMA01]